MEPWLEPLYDAAGMRSIDDWAIEERGVPSLDLMDAAGSALADAVRDVCGEGPVRIVCGKGNNGGDGLVAARELAASGFEVEPLLLWPEDELSGDAAASLARLDSGAEHVRADALGDRLAGSGAIVDAIFGTGFEGAPRDPARAAIEAINSSGAAVAAADIPSGVDAATGEAEGAAVEATVTVGFHAPKLGHRIAPGKGLTGDLRVAAIGIPDGAPASPAGGLIGAAVLESLPRREPGSTKFTSGEVLVVGGSRGLTGAVCMAAEAAIRCGAGYAAVAVPEDLEPIFEAKLTEVMSHGFGGAPGRLAASDADGIAAAAERAAAVVLGPGLGRDGASAALARSLPGRITAPLVIDADGLNAHAGEVESLADRQAPTVITPHAGELGRLLERDSAAIEAHRLDSAREAASRSGAIVVLKGDDTLVARGERIAVAPGGSPALATAGTGDVLAGAIAALLARGTEPWEAVCAGVMAQQGAGRIAARFIGSAESVIAGDVIAALPEALAGRSGSSPSDGRRAS